MNFKKMDEETRLLKILQEAREEIDDQLTIAYKLPTLEQFQNHMEIYYDKVERASRNYRMIAEPKYEDIPTYGDRMSLDSFIKNVKTGGFIDYDGSGNYIKDGKMSDITIYPSDVENHAIRKDFSEIIWFNR